MSALAIAHMSEVKKRTLTLQISELRKNDVIIEGMGIDEPVTVNKIFDPEYKEDTRCLTLINFRNSVFYRQLGAEVEVTIQN